MAWFSQIECLICGKLVANIRDHLERDHLVQGDGHFTCVCGVHCNIEVPGGGSQILYHLENLTSQEHARHVALAAAGAMFQRGRR